VGFELEVNRPLAPSLQARDDGQVVAARAAKNRFFSMMAPEFSNKSVVQF
jgi:hypothetical protein